MSRDRKETGKESDSQDSEKRWRWTGWWISRRPRGHRDDEQRCTLHRRQKKRYCMFHW